MYLKPSFWILWQKIFTVIPNVQQIAARPALDADILIGSSLKSMVLLRFSAVNHTHHNSLVLTDIVKGLGLKKINLESEFCHDLFPLHPSTHLLQIQGIFHLFKSISWKDLFPPSFYRCNELHSRHPEQLVPSWKLESPDSHFTWQLVHPAAIPALHLIQSDSLLTCREMLPALLSQRGIKCLNTHSRSISRPENLLIFIWKMNVIILQLWTGGTGTKTLCLSS